MYKASQAPEAVRTRSSTRNSSSHHSLISITCHQHLWNWNWGPQTFCTLRQSCVQNTHCYNSVRPPLNRGPRLTFSFFFFLCCFFTAALNSSSTMSSTILVWQKRRILPKNFASSCTMHTEICSNSLRKSPQASPEPIGSFPHLTPRTNSYPVLLSCHTCATSSFVLWPQDATDKRPGNLRRKFTHHFCILFVWIYVILVLFYNSQLLRHLNRWNDPVYHSNLNSWAECHWSVQQKPLTKWSSCVSLVSRIFDSLQKPTPHFMMGSQSWCLFIMSEVMSGSLSNRSPKRTVFSATFEKAENEQKYLAIVIFSHGESFETKTTQWPAPTGA